MSRRLPPAIFALLVAASCGAAARGGELGSRVAWTDGERAGLFDWRRPEEQIARKPEVSPRGLWGVLPPGVLPESPNAEPTAAAAPLAWRTHGPTRTRRPVVARSSRGPPAPFVC